MAWITLTEARLKTRISGTELEAFRAAALGAGQADPVAAVLADITRQVRGYVAGCARNQLGAAGTIPDELESAALDLAIIPVMTRAGGTLLDPKGARKDAADKAREMLRDVAACRLAIEQPATVSDEVTAAPSVEIVRSQPRRVSRDKVNGLL